MSKPVLKKRDNVFWLFSVFCRVAFILPPQAFTKISRFQGAFIIEIICVY